MNSLFGSETAMMKVIAFVKGLAKAQEREGDTVFSAGWAGAAKEAYSDSEDKLIVADVFKDETMEDWKW